MWHLLTAISCIFLLSLLLSVAVGVERVLGHQKQFLMLAGKYMELFFRLVILPLLVVALILHICPKWKCQWKIEMFHFSLKKRINTRGDVNSQSFTWNSWRGFFCSVLIFVLLPRKCYSSNFGQLRSYLVLGRPHFSLSFYVLLLIVLWYLPSS